MAAASGRGGGGRPRSAAVALAVALLLGAATAACGSGGDGDGDGAPAADGPNVVVVMTDDQTLDSLAIMPKTLAALGGEAGATFGTAVATLPLCCPSRTTLLTGQLAHNHGVLDNLPPDGGVAAFDGRESLAVWLSEAGYTTSHVGKYLNGYGQGAPPEVPPGWDRWHGLVDPSTYEYEGFEVFDGDQVTRPAGYQTDVLADLAVAEVEALAAADAPFFLSVATVAPHVAQPEGEALQVQDLAGQVDAILPPAPGREGAVEGLTVPRTPALEEADLTDKPQWVQDNDALISGLVASAGATAQFEALRDRFYRHYLSSLVAVDDAVGRVVDALEAAGELDDTLVVFTSDHGFHFGEHGLLLRKTDPYEDSILVPLLVRGPGVAGGTTVEAPVANTDVAATILDVTGVEPGLAQDGSSLLDALDDPEAAADRVVLLESRPRGNAVQPHFSGLRSARWTYVEYETGEVELYDLEVDPDQLENRAADPAYAPVVAELSAQLDELAACAGSDCVATIAPVEPQPA